MKKFLLSLFVGIPLLTSAASPHIIGLVAPIALYPDPLLADVLVACTLPDQVKAIQNQEVTTKLNPAVLIVAQYPDLLNFISANNWAAQMHTAIQKQPLQVIESIQELRQAAQELDNLKTDTSNKVINHTNFISIVSTTRHQYYLPNYDPRAVYLKAKTPITYSPVLEVHYSPYTIDWLRHQVVIKTHISPKLLTTATPIPVVVSGPIPTEAMSTVGINPPAPNNPIPAVRPVLHEHDADIWRAPSLEPYLAPKESPAPFITVIPEATTVTTFGWEPENNENFNNGRNHLHIENQSNPHQPSEKVIIVPQ